MTTKRKRLVSLVLAISVFFAMTCSVFYIATEANHDCTGADCPVCHQISVCEGMLKNLSSAVCAAAFTAMAAYALCASIVPRTGACRPITPVALKVKLTI